MCKILFGYKPVSKYKKNSKIIKCKWDNRICQKIGRFSCPPCNLLDRSTCVLFNGGDPSYTISSEWGEYMGTTTWSQGTGNRPSRALFRAIKCKPSSNMLNKLIYDTVASHKTPAILSLIASKDLIASLLLILIRTYICGFALICLL